MSAAAESCEVCGFVWEQLDPAQVEPRLRAAVTEFRSLLRRPSEALAQRPADGVWSALEYSAHCRDVLLVIRERTMLALVEDHPDPRPMYRDERVDRGWYAADTPAAVAAELEAAADLYCRLFGRLDDVALARTLVYGVPGADRTVAWMGAQAVHEIEHHLADARASLDATGAVGDAAPDRALVMEVVIDCAEPATLSAFYQRVIEGVREVRGEDWATVRDPRPGGVLLAFQRVPEPKVAKNRVHLDLWSTDLEADTARAVAAGATAVGAVVEDAQGPFQVMTDPEGNEFCFVG